MTDDQKALAAELDQLAAEHTKLATDAASLAIRVRRLGRVGDALDDLRDGAFLTVSQAAIICEVSDQTVLNWIADAERLDRPIAEKQVSWIIGRDALLDYVLARRQGCARCHRGAASGVLAEVAIAGAVHPCEEAGGGLIFWGIRIARYVWDHDHTVPASGTGSI